MNVQKLFNFALPLILLSAGFSAQVSATPVIASVAPTKGIILRTNPVCLTCHILPRGGFDTLRLGVFAAYNFDRLNLSRLRNLINGCPAGTGLNSVFLCQNVLRNGALGSTVSGTPATDVYEVFCGQGTAVLHTLVKDQLPAFPSLLSIQINKGNRASFLMIDPVDGDPPASGVAALADGAGRYTVNVNKLGTLAPGAEFYTAGFACRGALGRLLPTVVSVVPVQNQ